MNKYKCLDVLKSAKSVCIITHINPDADALASSCVFAKFLKEQFNLKADIFADFSILPKKYLNLLNGTKLNPKQKRYDTALMLDCPNSLRLGKFKGLFDGAKQRIVIDHHASNNFSGDVNIVEFVSSTCEIVYKILKSFDILHIDKEICELIYAGIITDTNNFTVGNFDSDTYKIAAEITKDINPKSIYQSLFANDIKNMQVLALAIEHIELFEEGKIIFSQISKKDALKLNLTELNYEGIINRLATISGNKFVCFVYPKNNDYYCSMRATAPYSVVDIAVKYGGGGHTGAAAFVSNKSIDCIKNIILKEFKEKLKNI